MESAETWHGRGPGRDEMRGRIYSKSRLYGDGNEATKTALAAVYQCHCTFIFLIYFAWEPSECFSRGTFWNEHREQGLWVGHAPLRIRKEAALVGSGFSFLWVWKENFFPWWPDSWVFIALCFWYLCADADMWACVFVCAHVDRGPGSMLVVAYQEVSFWFPSFFFFPPSILEFNPLIQVNQMHQEKTKHCFFSKNNTCWLFCILLRQVFSLVSRLHWLLDWLVKEPEGSFCFHLLNSGVTEEFYHIILFYFYMGAGGWTQVLLPQQAL